MMVARFLVSLRFVCHYLLTFVEAFVASRILGGRSNFIVAILVGVFEIFKVFRVFGATCWRGSEVVLVIV